MLRTCVRVAAAATLAAAAYVALPAAPASAAGCPTADGVTVVVDFHELGGGVQSGCVAGGGGDTASQLFPAAGFSLTYVQRQPGFVCRIDGAPADSPCVSTPPADAYWALFWSDGKSGSWSYATSGASGLRVPDGGYVAFSWNGSSARSAPGFTPAPHPSPSPTPTHSPTHAPTKAPSHQSSPSAPAPDPTTSASVAPSESPSTSKSAKPSRKPKPSASASEPSATPSETPSELPAVTSAEPTDPDDGGLPSWVAPAAVVVLFGAGGAAAVVRRRRGAA